MNRLNLYRVSIIVICLTLVTGCDQQSREVLGLSQPWPDQRRVQTDPPAATPARAQSSTEETASAAPATAPKVAEEQSKSEVAETQPPTVTANLDHEDLDATAWVQLSAEYHAIALQTYRMATEHLKEAVADKSWSAIPSQSESLRANPRNMPMAVVLDLDETVMDNSGFQAEMIKKNTQYSPAAWADWVSTRKARAVPGAAEFLKACRASGVRTFFVTNRAENLEENTKKNLIQLGILTESDPDIILTKGERSDWSSDKTTRRDFLALDLRILMLIGDDLHDFIWTGKDSSSSQRKATIEKYRSYVGDRWFVLPNPTYGSWERSLYDADTKTRQDQLKRKLDLLWTSESD